MAINPLYIPLFNIEEVILDKDTGLPLAAGVVKFYRDSQPLTPKPVYQISGTSGNYTFVCLGPELTLGLSGTFVNSDGDPIVPYAYPYDANGDLDLYYVTVESAGGVAQFVRKAVPYVDTGGITPSERTSTENEISNPQFVEMIISDGVNVIDVTGTNTVTQVAPGWDIITTGTGTLTLERLEPTSSGVVTNPPYALRIEASSGLGASFTLRQRFLNTPSIFRNNFASASLAAAVISGGGSFVSMNYIPSTGTPTELIASTSIPTDGAYHVISGNAAILDQANQAASIGYVDISITLPTSRNLAITSIQVVGTDLGVDIPFDEQTAARQIDHLFHYYKEPIFYKQVDSYLVGWDFPLNPAQIFGSSVTAHVGANQSYYGWDNTIIFQTTTSSFTLNRGSAGELVLNAAATTQGAIIQYLDATQSRKLLNQELCLNISALTTKTGGLPITVSLWYTTDASLPSTVGSNESLVDSLDADGKPDGFNGIWTELKTINGQTLTATIAESATDFTDYPFIGYNLDDAVVSNAITYFAVVIGTAQMETADTLHFNSVSLCPGSIPCRPAPKTADEVLRQCQALYETSYEPGVRPGTITNNGFIFINQKVTNPSVSPNTVCFPQSFSLQFKTIKRAAPQMSFYSPLAQPVGQAEAIARGGPGIDFSGTTFTFSSFFVSGNINRYNAEYIVTGTTQLVDHTGPSVATSSAYLLLHYVADSRFGL